MADSFTANPGSGGSVFASDDISSVHYPRIKLVHGADGTNDGDVANANPFPVKSVAIATGGATNFRSIDLDESEEEVKATAGVVYGIAFSNLATTTRYLHLYNATAANVTVGSTTPYFTIAIPGNATDDVSGVFTMPPQGMAFSTAISAAATTTLTGADAPGANEVLCNIMFV